MKIRTFREADLAAVVDYWNRAFVDRRNFRATTTDEFRARVLDCPLFDASGFFLAWDQTGGAEQLAGLAHAIRPPEPDSPAALKAGPEAAHHFLALLHVDPDRRRQGIGGRLLQAAENWLYYCPVHVGARETPCYGNPDGTLPPLFGPSGVPAIGVDNAAAINFLAHRGYRSTGLGDVTMLGPVPPAGTVPDSRVRSSSAFPPGLDWAGPEKVPPVLNGRGDDLDRLAVVDARGQILGTLDWSLLGEERWTITRWWVDEDWQGKGLGNKLLDEGLARMASSRPAAQVEIRVHLDRHRLAVDMLKRRGFVVDAAWVNLVKT